MFPGVAWEAVFLCSCSGFLKCDEDVLMWLIPFLVRPSRRPPECLQEILSAHVHNCRCLMSPRQTLPLCLEGYRWGVSNRYEKLYEVFNQPFLVLQKKTAR